MRQIILDTETTGLRVEDGNRILEIAAVEMVSRRLSRRHFHHLINPERDSEPGALEVHGIHNDMLAGKPLFAEIVDAFLDFVRGAELIIHNAAFDLGFLNAELARVGRGRMEDHVTGVIDTLVEARALFPGKRNNLDALCDRLGVDRSARTRHGALIDCELLAEVYLAMTRGQDSLLIDFSSTEGQAHAQSTSPIDLGGLTLRHHTASAAEQAEHEAYLDGLDKQVKGTCMWRQVEARAAETREAETRAANA